MTNTTIDMHRTIPVSTLLIAVALWPVVAFANGGDERVVAGKYLINLSRSPFTPQVGTKTAMLISFAELAADRLVAEDLLAKIRIGRLGQTGTPFEQSGLLVRGGVLEFSYTFPESGLYEIFIDFAFASGPQRVYSAPDFLLDVQPAVLPPRADRSLPAWFGVGAAVGAAAGYVFAKQRYGQRHS